MASPSQCIENKLPSCVRDEAALSGESSTQGPGKSDSHTSYSLELSAKQCKDALPGCLETFRSNEQASFDRFSMSDICTDILAQDDPGQILLDLDQPARSTEADNNTESKLLQTATIDQNTSWASCRRDSEPQCRDSDPKESKADSYDISVWATLSDCQSEPIFDLTCQNILDLTGKTNCSKGLATEAWLENSYSVANDSETNRNVPRAACSGGNKVQIESSPSNQSRQSLYRELAKSASAGHQLNTCSNMCNRTPVHSNRTGSHHFSARDKRQSWTVPHERLPVAFNVRHASETQGRSEQMENNELVCANKLRQKVSLSLLFLS